MPILLEASLKVKWDSAHKPSPAQIAPVVTERFTPFQGPPRCYTLWHTPF
jgi:hypothetical protein